MLLLIFNKSYLWAIIVMVYLLNIVNEVIRNVTSDVVIYIHSMIIRKI